MSVAAVRSAFGCVCYRKIRQFISKTKMELSFLCADEHIARLGCFTHGTSVSAMYRAMRC